jgi:hypothetical protein
MILKHLKRFEALKTKLGTQHRIYRNIIILGTTTTVPPCPRHRVNTR